jgi:primosomal protein N' (replication factor Y)
LGETEIIIGTQILAKGHNFPKLGFLGVIDGGLNFSGIDLRSSEKTYQILHQILGRIGRFDFLGNVMIQTYEPKNLILKALQSFNKTEFYSNELKQRKMFEMPPFFSLIKISFSGSFKEAVEIEANKFAGLLPLHKEVKILGPAPSSIFKINKKYRFNVFLQSKKNFDLHNFLISSLKQMNFNKNILIKIDVNPMNFI